jgi:hypothetical protein
MSRIRRLAILLAGLAAAMLGSVASATAAFAWPDPPGQPGGVYPLLPTPPVVTHTVVTGGMPGWQITLIAVGAAVLAAAIAVALDRAWAARRRVSANAA